MQAHISFSLAGDDEMLYDNGRIVSILLFLKSFGIVFTEFDDVVFRCLSTITPGLLSPCHALCNDAVYLFVCLQVCRGGSILHLDCKAPVMVYAVMLSICLSVYRSVEVGRYYTWIAKPLSCFMQ